MTQQTLASLRRRTAFGFALAALVGISGTLAPAEADWLITREGGRVETQGPWTVKGKLVVFKTAEGKLSSLRLAEVDLDASRRYTEEAVAARAQADAEEPGEEARPAERRRSVRSITDKDVRQAEPGERGLVVESWSPSRADGKLVVGGTLQNLSSAPMAELKLKVLIFDGSGALIATSQAALDAEMVPAGGSAGFRAEFPGVAAFESAAFEPAGRRLEAEQPEG